MQGHAHHTVLPKAGRNAAAISTDGEVRGCPVIKDHLPDAGAGMHPGYPAHFLRDIEKIVRTVDDFKGMCKVIPLWGRHRFLVKHSHGERFSLCPRSVADGKV